MRATLIVVAVVVTPVALLVGLGLLWVSLASGMADAMSTLAAQP